MPNLKIDEMISLSETQQRARARVLRRLQDYGPKHRLTKQATRTSLNITERIRSNSIELDYQEK